MKKFSILIGAFVIFAGVHAQEDSRSYWSKSVGWLKDQFGLGQEKPLRMDELKGIKVPVLGEKMEMVSHGSSMYRYPRENRTHYEFIENYKPHREVYVGLKYDPKEPIHFMSGRYGYDKRVPEYTKQIQQYEENAQLFDKVKPWINKAYVEGQNSVRLSDVNEQKYRYEGARNTGSLLAGTAAALYGLYHAYNWYRGPLNRARNDIITAKSRAKKALDIIKKENVGGTYKDKTMTDYLEEIVVDLEAISSLIPAKK